MVGWIQTLLFRRAIYIRIVQAVGGAYVLDGYSTVLEDLSSAVS